MYYCVNCKYKTSKKSSYTDHVASKKHTSSTLTLTSTLASELTSTSTSTICKYCTKQMSTVKNLKRHYKLCKDKQIYKREQKLQKQLKKIEKKAEMLEEVQNDYQDLLKQIVSSKTNKKAINVHYIINNFTEALNYEDLMSPEMTEEERKQIEHLEPLAATVYMIEKRCINNIEIHKRPLHCLDTSRNKYMVRTQNQWKIDHYAKHILKGASQHLFSMYLTDPTDTDLPIEQIMKNQQKLITLESKKSQNKMIHDLNDKVHIKNINP